MAHRHKQKHEQRTFSSILDSVASANSMKLMERARLANRIAKSLRGEARVRAYAVKHGSLLVLKAKFPDRVRVVNDFNTPQFVVVESKTVRFGLHAPEELFADNLVRVQTAVAPLAAKQQAA